MNKRLSVAVIGASGLTGGELCRLLLSHPAVEKIHPVARTEEPFDRVHRNLLGAGLEFVGLDDVKAIAKDIDCVFFATPSGEAMRHATDFLEAGCRVVDLSPDFRFADPEVYESVYHAKHQAPHLLKTAVYGVTEFYRESLRNAMLVANPGCYVITALLSLAPLMRSDVIQFEQQISISALNGTSGAGSSAKRELLHHFAANDVLPYSLEGHRHGPEIEDRLACLAGRNVSVDFNTAHGSIPRGIYLQASLQMRPDCGSLSREHVIDMYEQYYGKGAEKEFFVRIVSNERSGGVHAKDYVIYPSVARVVGSNFCHIGIDVNEDKRLIKVVGVIDNLVKGAAGSAIQNMNVMLGLDERAGLNHYGL